MELIAGPPSLLDGKEALQFALEQWSRRWGREVIWRRLEQQWQPQSRQLNAAVGSSSHCLRSHSRDCGLRVLVWSRQRKMKMERVVMVEA
ncbi:hypothetical protein GBA52_027131 [Prunus armeniaca]|nr:hypothetical protein GBA52_027131 [Prunus armeniaca]